MTEDEVKNLTRERAADIARYLREAVDELDGRQNVNFLRSPLRDALRAVEGICTNADVTFYDAMDDRIGEPTRRARIERSIPPRGQGSITVRVRLLDGRSVPEATRAAVISPDASDRASIRVWFGAGPPGLADAFNFELF